MWGNQASDISPLVVGMWPRYRRYADPRFSRMMEGYRWTGKIQPAVYPRLPWQKDRVQPMMAAFQGERVSSACGRACPRMLSITWVIGLPDRTQGASRAGRLGARSGADRGDAHEQGCEGFQADRPGRSAPAQGRGYQDPRG